MFSEIFDWFISFLGNNDGNAQVPTDGIDGADCNADADGVDSGEQDVAGEDAGGIDVVETGTVGERGSVKDMLNSGISTQSVSDEELAELSGKHDQTSFEGHTACQCNVCGCGHFVPSSGDGKYCKCGHDVYQHEWKS